MKKILLIMLLLIITVCNSFADSYLDKFVKAGEYYKHGEYQNASTLYQSLVDSGFSSPELYYNLGNSYYKTNQISSAILYFEKAKKISAFDDDIEHNLNLSNQKTIDKIQQPEPFFLSKINDSIANHFTSASWAAIMIIFAWLTFIALVLFFVIQSIKMRKIILPFAFLCTIMTIGSFAYTSYKSSLEEQRNYGIIFAPALNVLSGIDAGSNIKFILHEGTKVQIIDNKSEWLRIKLIDGRDGWMMKKDLKNI